MITFKSTAFLIILLLLISSDYVHADYTGCLRGMLYRISRTAYSGETFVPAKKIYVIGREVKPSSKAPKAYRLPYQSPVDILQKSFDDFIKKAKDDAIFKADYILDPMNDDLVGVRRLYTTENVDEVIESFSEYASYARYRIENTTDDIVDGISKDELHRELIRRASAALEAQAVRHSVILDSRGKFQIKILTDVSGVGYLNKYADTIQREFGDSLIYDPWTLIEQKARAGYKPHEKSILLPHEAFFPNLTGHSGAIKAKPLRVGLIETFNSAGKKILQQNFESHLDFWDAIGRASDDVIKGSSSSQEARYAASIITGNLEGMAQEIIALKKKALGVIKLTQTYAPTAREVDGRIFAVVDHTANGQKFRFSVLVPKSNGIADVHNGKYIKEILEQHAIDLNENLEVLEIIKRDYLPMLVSENETQRKIMFKALSNFEKKMRNNPPVGNPNRVPVKKLLNQVTSEAFYNGADGP